MNEDSKSGDTSEVISSFGSPTNFLNNSNNKLSSIVSSRRQSINKLEAINKKKRRSSLSMLNEMMMTEIKESKDENGKKVSESSDSNTYSSNTSGSQNFSSNLIKNNSKSSAYNSKNHLKNKNHLSNIGKNTNSDNSHSEQLGLLSRNQNTILGVNFITEDKKPKKKKKFDSSITGSMKLFFGTKLKKEFQNKLRTAKSLIKQNQDKLSENIIKAIKDDDLNLIQDLMLSETNKIIYKKILEKENFINMMLINKRMKMLMMVLDDDFYKFNALFPFEYITKKLKFRNNNIFENEELKQFLINVVESGLYEKGLTKVMGWFLVCFDLKQEFIHFININSEYYPYEQRIYLDNDYELINEYKNNTQNFNEILKLCLENNLEELAIELVNVEGKLENGSVINTAIKFNNKDFLKYVWEEPILS